MKNLALISALALAASAALAAQEGNPLPEPVAKSSVTREQLRSELAVFKAKTSPYSINFNPVKNFKSTVTAQQIKADFLASREEVAANGREDSGSQYVPRRRGKFRKLAGN